MLNGVPRILIIRLSAIGDVIRVLPSLHALRDAYPNAQIDWAVEPKSVDVIEGHPALDRALVFERTEGIWQGSQAFRSFCRQIRENRYDIVVDFHGILKSGLIMRASGAKQRLAFASPRSQEFSHLFATDRITLPSDRMNRIEENLELCKALGAKVHNLDVVLDVPEDIDDHVDAYIEETFHGAKSIVVLHVPVDRPEKQWPVEHFAALVDLILSDGRFEALLTWGPGQRASVEAVHALSRRKPHIAPEMPSLKYYIRLLQRVGLFVGGDTGPMHLASAVGTPVVAIFGGTDPVRHAPLRQPSTVLYAGPEPAPKTMGRADAERYLRAVSPEQVYDACVKLLHA